MLGHESNKENIGNTPFEYPELYKLVKKVYRKSTGLEQQSITNSYQRELKEGLLSSQEVRVELQFKLTESTNSLYDYFKRRTSRKNKRSNDDEIKSLGKSLKKMRLNIKQEDKKDDIEKLRPSVESQKSSTINESKNTPGPSPLTDRCLNKQSPLHHKVKTKNNDNTSDESDSECEPIGKRQKRITGTVQKTSEGFPEGVSEEEKVFEYEEAPKCPNVGEAQSKIKKESSSKSLMKQGEPYMKRKADITENKSEKAMISKTKSRLRKSRHKSPKAREDEEILH